MLNKHKVTAQIVAGIILWVLAIVFFGGAIWLLVEDKTVSAVTGAGFGTIILFLANLDRFESFKGFGLEAKTRDLRNAIVDAESALTRLEEMSTEIKSLSDSISTLHYHLDETKILAQRAKALTDIEL